MRLLCVQTARGLATLFRDWQAGPRRGRRRRVVFGSSVNVSHPDLRRHPLLPRASPHVCTLREGETLLLPAFWHHEVHSEATTSGDVNVAVNFWFRNVRPPPEGF